jgi:hypothetical protein
LDRDVRPCREGPSDPRWSGSHGKTRSRLSLSHRGCGSWQARHGAGRVQAWEGIQGPYVSIGEIPEKIDVATFLDDSFTDAANDFTTTDVKTNVKEWKAANPDKLIQ